MLEPKYPQPKTVIYTDINLGRAYLADLADLTGTSEGPDLLTFRTVLDLSTNTLAMQVLEDGRLIAERGVYQGVAQEHNKEVVQGEGHDAG